MKKILRENIYSTLIIFCFILAILIYWIIRFYYPAEVYKILMEVEPGYLLLNEKLGRGTFGDMYGALNTFFSGLAFIGAFVAIFLQIYLYRHDKAIAKQEKEDEERQQLYYIWFRLDSIVSPVISIVNDCNDAIDMYSQMKVEEIKNISYINSHVDDMNAVLKQLNELNNERNHLLYLKFFNDKGLINLFANIPLFIKNINEHVEEINQTVKKKNPAYTERYFSHMIDKVINLKIDLMSYGNNKNNKTSADIRKQIVLIIQEFDKSLVERTIEFDTLQELLRKILSLLNKLNEEEFSHFKSFHVSKKYFTFTVIDFYKEESKDLSKKLNSHNTLIIPFSTTLNKLKSKSKIPESI